MSTTHVLLYERDVPCGYVLSWQEEQRPAIGCGCKSHVGVLVACSPLCGRVLACCCFFVAARYEGALRNLATAEQHAVAAASARSIPTAAGAAGGAGPGVVPPSAALRSLQRGDVSEVEALMSAVSAAEAAAEVIRAERDALAVQLEVCVGGGGQCACACVRVWGLVEALHPRA
jgi:hypothetical protein